MINRRDFLTGVSGTVALRRASGYARAVSLPDHTLAERLASDPLRPQFHFLSAANWMNDPNGPIYWNGLR